MTRARVLLADDNESVLEKVAGLLAASFEVIGKAHDGRELVSAALRLLPDVIVADIGMPGCTGIEAAHRLREAESTTKVVFLTIHQEREFVDACLEEGALGYVVKSRMKSDLVPAIEAALAGKSFISPALAH